MEAKLFVLTFLFRSAGNVKLNQCFKFLFLKGEIEGQSACYRKHINNIYVV